ncbi:MAG TPA: hypothetical protein VFV40_00620, partial [Nocardioides sp.]|nr:hypothetical protein [Nocardioides sp.]
MTSRRRGGIAKVVGLLLVSLTLAGAPALSAGAATPPPTPLWIATYNVHTDVTVAAAQADIAKLVNAGADVIGLQEMGSRERRDAVR